MLLTAEHNQFEQRMETCEGLAKFIETRCLDCFPQLDAKAAMTLPPTSMGLSIRGCLGTFAFMHRQ